MSLALIVTALRNAIAGVSGINACYPRIPETPPADAIFAVIETPSGTIQSQASDMDRIEYLANVYVAVKRNGAIWAEQDAVLPFADSVPAALRGAFTLGGTTYGTRYSDPAWELTEFEIKDQTYLAIKFGILYKQKAIVTFSG